VSERGDPTKQPPECPNRPGVRGNPTTCPYIKETGGGFEGEQYNCDRCGERFFLDYEDMK
jgi:hypothetical protein